MIQCSECESYVTWQQQKGRYYGSCQRKSSSCKGNKFIREDTLEKEIQNQLEFLIAPTAEVVDWVCSAMKQKHQNDSKSTAQIIVSLENQAGRLDRMLNNLYDDKLAGEISADIYIQKRAQLEAQHEELESQLATLDADATKRLETRIVIFTLSQKAGSIYRKCTAEQKRLIITKLFEKLTYKGGSVSVKYTRFAQVIAQKSFKNRKILGDMK